MKPVHLSMTAFGPYDEKTVIDFRQFDQEKLFLITGKTGSGKTTIFDAITYALYGKSSGGSRQSNTLRCQNSPKERRTSVIFEFHYKGNTYKIERYPEHIDYKLIRWNTKERARVALYLPNGHVEEGEKQVETAVKNLLGIDYEQFRQIVMLAQGQFEKLLHANSSEREGIFRRIFNTTQYSDFQDQMKERTSVLKMEVEMKLNAYILDLYDVQLAEPEESIYVSDQLRKLLSLPSPDIYQRCTAQLNSFIDVDYKLGDQAEKKSDKIQAEILDVTKNITSAENNNTLLAECKIAQETYDELELQKESIDKIIVEITLARKAHSIIPKEILAKKATESKNLAEHDIRENQCIIDTKTPHEAEIRTKIDAEKKRPEVEQWRKRLTQISGQIDKYLDVNTRDAELAGVTKNLIEGTTSLDDIQCIINTYISELKDIDDTLVNIKNCDVDKAECEHIYQNTMTHLFALNDLYVGIIDLKQEEKRLSKLREETSRLLDAYSAKNTIYSELHDVFLREQAGILAQTLETGKPCPVCGSIEHPAPAKTSEDVPSKQKLDEAKKEAEDAEKECEKVSGTSRDQGVKCKGLEESLLKNAKDILNKESTREELETDLPKIIKKAEVNKEELKQKYDKLQKICEQKIELEKKRPDILWEIKAEEIKAEEITKNNIALALKKERLESEIQTIRKDLLYPSKEEAEREISTIKTNIKTHENQIHEWEIKENKLKTDIDQARGIVKDLSKKMDELIKNEISAWEIFENALQEKGFADKEVYLLACRDDTILGDMEKIVSDYTSSYTTADTRLKQLKYQTKDKVWVNILELEQIRSSLNETKRDVDNKKNTHLARANANKKIGKCITKDYYYWKTWVKTYDMLKNLSDTANGGLVGKDKLTFERYIQMVYFDQILCMANKRLDIMSEGRYELIRSDGVAKYKNVTGLELDVMDKFTGSPRPVTTLSGGESFQASLSLALGLSDIIQSQNGGVQLDTMFVDEGFGSLDPEALEISLRVLKDLTAGNRLVGVISHVDVLKDYINPKIEIIKKPGGYSTLRVET